MIQGSGGMGKAVIAAFRDAGFRDVIIAARNRQRGLALAKQYGFQWQPLPEGIAAEILVNVTPLGMAGERKATRWRSARPWWTRPASCLTWSRCRRKLR